jgi:hypothetical protein
MRVTAIGTAGTPEQGVIAQDKLLLFAIAEGVGRTAAGMRHAVHVIQEEAGNLDTLAQNADAERNAKARQALDDAMEGAFYAIDHAIVTDPSAAGIATTGLVLAQISGPRLHLATVGSSSAWLIRGGHLQRINRDRSGEALGTSLPVDVDVGEALLVNGDVVALCTSRAVKVLGEDRLAAELSVPDADFPEAVAGMAKAVGTGLVAFRVSTEERTSAVAMARVLGSSFLFRGLSVPERMTIGGYLEERTIEPGQVLMREGDAGDEFFTVLEGNLRITRGGKHLRDAGAGTALGELALIGSGVRSATATALDQVKVVAMSRDRFEALAFRRPEIGVRLAMALLGTVSERLRDLTERYASEG